MNNENPRKGLEKCEKFIYKGHSKSISLFCSKVRNDCYRLARAICSIFISKLLKHCFYHKKSDPDLKSIFQVRVVLIQKGNATCSLQYRKSDLRDTVPNVLPALTSIFLFSKSDSDTAYFLIFVATKPPQFSIDWQFDILKERFYSSI